jgi:hypothetical protein
MMTSQRLNLLFTATSKAHTAVAQELTGGRSG